MGRGEKPVGQVSAARPPRRDPAAAAPATHSTRSVVAGVAALYAATVSRSTQAVDAVAAWLQDSSSNGMTAQAVTTAAAAAAWP